MNLQLKKRILCKTSENFFRRETPKTPRFTEKIWAPAMIRALHHVQLAMPRGREDEARAFYRDVLGMTEQAKPENLARRGGVWFSAGDAQVHLGVEDDFRPAKKAHPALLVVNLPELHERCRNVTTYERAYIADPFGNRIELLELIASA